MTFYAKPLSIEGMKKEALLSQYLSELGKRGGRASSDKLSPAKRKARAKLAAAARWKKATKAKRTRKD